MPPSFGQYANDHTKEWAQKIASFDGFVIVTPEYNHGTSGVLKNAIDYDALSTLLDQVVAWSAALAPLRETAPAA
jgi:NAD(P)H-dependent FMN reductase